MPDPTAPTPAKPDPFGPWAPYVRWLLLVALLILGPKLGLTPGQIPPLPADLPGEVKGIAAAVQRIEAGQVQVLRAAGVPPQ